MCPMGINNVEAAITAANGSYLSPKTIKISGLISSNILVKFIIALPTAFPKDISLISLSSYIGIILVIENPSLLIISMEFPYLLSRCIPVTRKTNSSFFDSITF